MERQVRRLSPPAMAEVIFDSVYLVFVICAGIFMMIASKGTNLPLLLYGMMAVVLGGGDSFHLVPRILGHLNGMERYTKELGVGKKITSITMTVFYVMLYLIWAIFYAMSSREGIGLAVIALAAIRIVICLLPQNRWEEEDAPLSFGVYRNIPFFLMGVLVIVMYASTSFVQKDLFWCMPFAVTLSFLFYLPVVLFSQSHPKVGMLMLPKTAAYVWIVCMGLQLLF